MFGYDFMVEQDWTVKLIEINTNPSLDYNPVEVPFKEKMFPRMLDSAFRIALDPYFPPPKDRVYVGLPPCSDFTDNPKLSHKSVVRGGKSLSAGGWEAKVSYVKGRGGGSPAAVPEGMENRWELIYKEFADEEEEEEEEKTVTEP